MKRPSLTVDLPPTLAELRLKALSYLRDLVECANALVSQVEPAAVDVTAAYTVSPLDRVVQVAPSAPLTITLPVATRAPGRFLTIKRNNGTTHTITVQPASGNIDGSASVTLTTAWQVRHFFSDGVAWTTH